MQRIALKIVTFALFLAGLHLLAQPLSPARKAVYLETRTAAAAPSPAAGIDYESFFRTFLIVRLQQSRRLQVESRNEPPCSTQTKVETVGAGAQVRGQSEAASAGAYFRIATRVQQRRDSAGKILDVTIDYDVTSMDDCRASSLVHDKVSFSPEGAFAEIQSLAETISTRIEEEAAEKIPVFVRSPQGIGAGSGVYQNYLRGVRSALADAADYRIVLSPTPDSALYVVDADIKLTSSRKKNAGTVEWKIRIRDNQSGQTYDDFPVQTTQYRDNSDLNGVYVDAGATIVSAVSELRYRQLAKIEGDSAQVTGAVILRRASALLCVQLTGEEERDCDPRPQVALSLLAGKGVATRDDDFEALYLKGEASYQVHQYDAAASGFEKALSKLPSDRLELRLTLRRRAGEARSALGSFDKAAEDFRQNIQERESLRNNLPARLGPQAGEYAALAECYRQLGKTNDALNALLSGAALGLDAAEIGSNLNSVLDKLTGMDLEAAIARAERVPSIDQNYLTNARQRLADYYDAQGRYLDSAQLHEKIYRILAAASSPSQHDLCLETNKAGLAFANAGDYDKAIQYDQLARDYGKTVWRPEEESTSVLVRVIADVYIKQGNPGKAETVLRDLIAGLRTQPGVANDVMVADLRLLETSLEQQQNYTEAGKVLDEVMDKQKTAYGAQSREYAALLEDKATLYREMYRFDQSETLHKQALEAYRIAAGPDATVVATVLNNLGLVQQFRGDFANALSSYDNAAVINRKNKPEDVWRSLTTNLQNAARVSARIGDADRPPAQKADELAKEALKIAQQRETDPAYENAVAFNTLGEVLADYGNYKEAGAAFQSGIAFYGKKEVSIPDRYTEYSALRGQALLLRLRGDFAAALSALTQASSVVRQRWGANDWRETLITVDRGQVALARGQWREAEELCDTAEKIRLGSQAADQWLEFIVRSLRADIALARGDLATARQLSAALDTDSRRMLTVHSPYTLESRVRLAHVMVLSGDWKGAGQLLDEFDVRNLHISAHHWALGEREHVMALISAQDARNTADAEKHFARAEEVYADVGGPECPRMARLLRDRAAFLNRANRAAEAAAALAQAERIEARYGSR